MTKDQRKKIDQLSDEHYTVYDGLKDLAKNGFLMVILTVIFTGAMIYWKVETLGVESMKQATDIKEVNDTTKSIRRDFTNYVIGKMKVAQSSTEVTMNLK